MSGSKDGAFIADAKLAAGVDDKGNEHPLNCDETGTLEVDITGTSGGPLDVIVDNIVPVSGSVSVSNFPAKQAVDNLTQLVPFEYDYMALTYTGSNITLVVYKVGGAGGTTVATLTLTYDGNNNILTVTRS